MMKQAKHYLKLVEWSEEDQCYLGSSPGFLGPCCHGKDETKVYKQLGQIIEDWIERYKKENKPLPESFASKHFSGKFVLRVGEDLHKALAIKATLAEESMNTYCTKQLKEAIIRG
jgi:predicted HicB family RNase H-like nuclease